MDKKISFSTQLLFPITESDDPCCTKPQLILSPQSEWVCVNCGAVVARNLINSERRAYTMEEFSSRKRTEPTWRSFGSRTVIGHNLTDAHGNKIHPQNRALFARLSKIQGSLINSLERNFWESRPKLNSLSKRLGLPDHIQETAWIIYRTSAKKRLTMGRSIEGFVAASVYAAIRVHRYPRLLEEVVESACIPLRNVHKCLSIIVHNVLPDLGLKYRPIRSERLIYRFGNELKLSIQIQRSANELLQNARKKGLHRMGKDPKGLAAAVLYLAARDTEEKRTQAQISTIARITEVTLRTRAKQILKFIDPIIFAKTLSAVKSNTNKNVNQNSPTFNQ